MSFQLDISEHGIWNDYANGLQSTPLLIHTTPEVWELEWTWQLKTLGLQRCIREEEEIRYCQINTHAVKTQVLLIFLKLKKNIKFPLQVYLKKKIKTKPRYDRWVKFMGDGKKPEAEENKSSLFVWFLRVVLYDRK